jgi:hypothetical protein
MLYPGPGNIEPALQDLYYFESVMLRKYDELLNLPDDSPTATQPVPNTGN